MLLNLVKEAKNLSVMTVLFVLISPLSVAAETINVIAIKYYPLIPESGVPQNYQRLDTKQTRIKMGLDPAGAAIDDARGEYNYTLSQIRQRVSEIQTGAKDALEEGTRYHGYKNPSTVKAINYNFVANQEILAPVPLSSKLYEGLPLPDYWTMLNQQNICNYVDNLGVKEVWLYTYAGAGKALWESNVSSKYGDISNSDRDPNDLPACQNSYTVYDYNYGRYIPEAVHNHLHQFEAIFANVDNQLFQKFMGFKNFDRSLELTEEVKQSGVRHCGNTHFPINAEKEEYEYNNPNTVKSDCEDWHPNGTGITQEISANTWNNDELNYYIYWMQNIPGSNNNLTDCPADSTSRCVPTKQLKNWWSFIYEFDNAYQDKTFWQNAGIIQSTQTVDSKFNIFGAGRAVVPSPGGGGGGQLPKFIRFTAGSGKVLTFSSVTGQTSCCGEGGNFNGPDGGGFATDINSFDGISGIIHNQKTMFLVGVFLNDSEPAGSAPPRLNFSSNALPGALGENFETLSPQLNQVFFIGDGRTQSGITQRFNVPPGATRLFLGFADAYSFQGNPGWYNDNVGALSVNLSISSTGLSPEPVEPVPCLPCPPKQNCPDQCQVPPQ